MSCPLILYRAFTDLEYAEKFINSGNFRIGSLIKYRDIEDSKRVDPTEGLGNYIDNENITENFQLGNAIYVLCCSSDAVNINFLKSNMGEYIVKINNPLKLISEITEYFKNNNLGLLGKVKCGAVSYNKGTQINDNLDKDQRAILSILQKPTNYSEENEVRIYAIFNHGPQSMSSTPYIDIDLGHPLTYAELLTHEKS